MSDFHLVIVDTTGIQSFIFGSNRLRENVGASYLVHMATGGWLMEEPDSLLPAGKHNIIQASRSREDGRKIEEDNSLAVELLYAGGGNSVLLFRSGLDALEFGRRLSLRLITEAPGLDAVIVVEPFNWNDNLAQVMQRAMHKLGRKKSERARSQPVLGLGVTAACASTGVVANYHEPEPGDMPTNQRARLSISAEVAAKWDNNAAAKARLEKEVPVPEGFDYPDDFDSLGRSEGEQSYIGVVHADGNGMGAILERITSLFINESSPKNRQYITELRCFSDDANRVGLEALKAVVEKVGEWNRLGMEKDQQPSSPGAMRLPPFYPTKRQNGAVKPFISIRPIVFGGDDVTFVCDGRIALQAAKVFLDAFGQKEIYKESAIACAGVAIVKVHYPFARAYELAESLTKQAKSVYNREAPAIDWHLAQSGLFGTLSQIRLAEYEHKPDPQDKTKDSLLMRPVVTDASKAKDWRTWDNLITILREFQQSPQNSELGKWPRNKVMGLRAELANSRWDAERTSLRQHIRQLRLSPQKLKLPAILNGDDHYLDTGWIGRRCVYFDAVELIEQVIEYANQATAAQQAKTEVLA